MLRIIVLTGALLGFLFLAGCDIFSPNQGTGEIRMYLVDSPAAFEKVNIVIEKVEIHRSGDDTTKGWIVINSTPQTHDLLKLRNGATAVLGSSKLDVGKYTQIRLIIGQGSNVIVGGMQHSLIIPSGSQTGLKLIHPFDIEEGQLYELTLDFDAERSIHMSGNTYMLKPTIRVMANVTSGTISGRVLPLASRPTVWTTLGVDTIRTIADTLTGDFRLMALPEGSYSVRVRPSSPLYKDSVITNVNVTARQNTNLGTITLPLK